MKPPKPGSQEAEEEVALFLIERETLRQQHPILTEEELDYMMDHSIRRATGESFSNNNFWII